MRAVPPRGPQAKKYNAGAIRHSVGGKVAATTNRAEVLQSGHGVNGRVRPGTLCTFKTLRPRRPPTPASPFAQKQKKRASSLLRTRTLRFVGWQRRITGPGNYLGLSRALPTPSYLAVWTAWAKSRGSNVKYHQLQPATLPTTLERAPDRVEPNSHTGP